ncbi:hypothetical protein EQV77_01265 [Halobacillus fulvus]|nr:hypothetical protein EQV77_01265 [Halobacillus fulvus]
MWKETALVLCLGIGLIGCQSENGSLQDDSEDFYEPVQYKADEGIKRRGQIPTGEDSYFKRSAEDEFRHSRYDETNKAHDNDFNNEESMTIMEKVNELDEVTLTQAFANDDHVYIAVMINPYNRRDHSIPEKIRAKVEPLTDKPITIYTNNNRWDNAKDLNARLNATQAPEKLKEKIRNFFNRDTDGQ